MFFVDKLLQIQNNYQPGVEMNNKLQPSKKGYKEISIVYDMIYL